MQFSVPHIIVTVDETSRRSRVYPANSLGAERAERSGARNKVHLVNDEAGVAICGFARIKFAARAGDALSSVATERAAPRRVAASRSIDV